MKTTNLLENLVTLRDYLEVMQKLGVICWTNGSSLILGSTKTEKTLLITEDNKQGQEKIIEYCKKYITRNGWRLNK